MKNTLSFSNAAKAAAACAICAVACLLVGWLSSLFQGESLSQWYPLIKKPSFTPPSMVFPIAWCILYVLSGISAGLVLTSPKEGKTAPILIFCAQLFANFLWSVPVLWHAQPRCRSRRLYRVAYTGCTVRQVRMEYFKNSLYYIRPLRPVVRVRYNLKSLDCIFKLNFFDSYIPVAKAQTKWFFRDIGRAGNKIPLGVGSQGESPI